MRLSCVLEAIISHQLTVKKPAEKAKTYNTEGHKQVSDKIFTFFYSSIFFFLFLFFFFFRSVGITPAFSDIFMHDIPRLDAET
jgi:hypothetical protein